MGGEVHVYAENKIKVVKKNIWFASSKKWCIENFPSLMKRNLIKHFQCLICHCGDTIDEDAIDRKRRWKNFWSTCRLFWKFLSSKKFNIKEAKKEWKKVGLVLSKTLKTCSNFMIHDQFINCYFKIFSSKFDQVLIY